MRILKRTKIFPVTLLPGDSLQLTYTDEQGNKTVHIEDHFVRSVTFDEAFTFEDVIDGKNALGGGWLEQTDGREEAD